MYTSFIKNLLNHIVMLAIFGIFTALITKTAYGAPDSNPAATSPAQSNLKADAAATKPKSLKNSLTPEKRQILSETKQRRAIILVTNIQKRLSAVNNRLQNITQRVAKRLTKMEKRGFDAAELRVELNTVFEKQRIINKKISQLNNVRINKIFTGNNTRKNWLLLKKEINTIKTELLDNKQSLYSIILKMRSTIDSGGGKSETNNNR